MLTAGVLDRDRQGAFVLYETEECDEDEAILAHAARDANRLVLTRLSDPEEFVGFCPLPQDWAFSAAAMTAEGEILLSTSAGAERDVILGSGTTREDALARGRMTTLKTLGNRLYALGYGGQIYFRRPGTPWSDISIPPAAGASRSDVCLYAVAGLGDEDAIVAAGTRISDIGDRPDIDAAFDAGDGELFADLILKATRPDLMTIERLRGGTWSDTEFDYQGIVAEILPDPEAGWLVFGGNGVLWHTSDFAAFDERVVLDRKRRFFDMKLSSGEVLIMVNQTLLRLEGDSLVPFDPALPPLDTGYANVTAVSGQLAAVHAGGIMILESGRWRNLVAEIPA
jgi:hypothetical protein